jgi:hypothetical protein
MNFFDPWLPQVEKNQHFSMPLTFPTEQLKITSENTLKLNNKPAKIINYIIICEVLALPALKTQTLPIIVLGLNADRSPKRR